MLGAAIVHTQHPGLIHALQGTDKIITRHHSYCRVGSASAISMMFNSGWGGPLCSATHDL
jgi:hypothetical protein